MSGDYENMKKEVVKGDVRGIPVPLPQFLKEGKWVVVGEGNPLPVDVGGNIEIGDIDFGDLEASVETTPENPLHTELVGGLPGDYPDSAVKAELELIKQTIEKYKEYRILSTDPFPPAMPEEKGAQLIVMDTGEIYFNHGDSWGEF